MMQLKKWLYACISCLALSALMFLPSCDEDEPGPDAPAVTRDTTATLVLQGQTSVFCLDDDIFDLDNVTSASICYNSGIGAVVSETEACVTITNDVDEFAPDTLCVVHCNELACDTTVIIVVACPGCYNDPHECFPYEPNNSMDGRPETWGEPDDVTTVYLITPADPGGGYWEVTATTDPDAVPRMAIDNDVDAPGTIVGAIAPESNRQEVRTRFLAHPGMVYTVEVDAFFEPPMHPWPVSISYTYNSIVDCYEPNNTQAMAKFIPRDESISAYALAGHIDYFVETGAENTFDWYKFRLEQDRKIRVALTNSPDDIRMTLALYNEAGSQVGTDLTLTFGGLNDNGRQFYIETPGEVPAGMYYVRVHQFNAERKVENDDPVPNHWRTPYALVVTTP